MKIRLLKFSAVLIAWLTLLAVVVVFYFWHWLNHSPEVAHDAYVFPVKKGASVYSVANELQTLGMLRWPKVWIWYARLTKETAIKTGEFRFNGAETPKQILEKLQTNDVVNYQVTIVEGSRFKDVLAKLAAEQKLQHTLLPDQALEQLQKAGIDQPHLEGWIFPDTYQFTAGETDVSILLRAYRRMQNVLEHEWNNKAQGLPYSSPYEALIMASIVEKETGAAFERGQIAGVFVRRLNQNMRLQTDPTVIYGMGDNYTGNITRKNLREATPYNTYVIRGLPPTPIALPGREAIHAALHPEEGETLFFVAKGDGTHHFSVTIDEHINAVNRYQKRRRADYRSAPAISPSQEPNETPRKDSSETSAGGAK